MYFSFPIREIRTISDLFSALLPCWLYTVWSPYIWSTLSNGDFISFYSNKMKSITDHIPTHILTYKDIFPLSGSSVGRFVFSLAKGCVTLVCKVTVNRSFLKEPSLDPQPAHYKSTSIFRTVVEVKFKNSWKGGGGTITCPSSEEWNVSVRF